MSWLSGALHFKPPGPVSRAYILDRVSKVKALLGPVGGGKTVSNIYDGIRAASAMPPCNDGIIRYRRAVIGSTYGQIERNLYPSWKRWLPEDGGEFTCESEWKGGGGRSAIHKLGWEALSGNRLVEVRAEYIFAAVGDQSVEEFCRGFEPTDAWLFEMDQLPPNLLQVIMTRIGRYPATGDAPDAVPLAVPFHYYVGCDLNAPDTDSDFYKTFEEDRPEGFKVYKQPSGRSAQAENRANLRPDYYDNQVRLLSAQRGGKHLIARMVDAKYAPSRDGEPVYDSYDDSIHLLPEIAALPDVPLELGFDQGVRRPACVIGQPAGQQLRILAEVVPGRMNARRFAQAVREKISEVAPGVPLAEVHYADPAGFTGADTEAGDLAWAETLALELGIVILPTDTNEIDPRLTAVEDELTCLLEGGRPALVISRKHCPMLRKGFVSHYRYRREKVGSSERTSDKPEKNDWSNPHDALQYLCLGRKGRYGVIEGPRPAHAPERRPRQGADEGCRLLEAPVRF